MAVAIDRNEIGFNRTTHSTIIPNNDIAKIMYYLHCVCKALHYDQDEDIRHYTDYANWARLSIEEQTFLLYLCHTFSLDVLDDKVFFHCEELCVQFTIEFYDISQVHHRLVAVESIIIAGRAHRVTCIMAYKMSWMQMYYLEPMQRLARQFLGQSSQSRLIRPVLAPVVGRGCCCIIL
jgi:hypothetical protein